MFGFDGGGADGLCGIDHCGGPGIDTVDVLGAGGADHGVVREGNFDSDQPVDTVNVSDDGLTCCLVMFPHDQLSLFDMFGEAAERTGLRKVPSHFVGQTTFVKSERKLLPVNGWAGAKTGTMPHGFNRGESFGETTMFRAHYQVPSWGRQGFDRDVNAYVDVAGMTWKYLDRGYCESRLLVRVLPVCANHTQGNIKAYKTAAVAVSKHVQVRVAPYVTEVAAAPEPVRLRDVVERQVASVVASGTDLLSVLRQSVPQFGMVSPLVASLPNLPPVPQPAPVQEVASGLITREMLVPPRRRAHA